jgi:hypothetical protein
MQKEHEFGGWFDIDEGIRAWSLPKKGFGRTQKKEDVMLGLDDRMLYVITYANKKVKKMEPFNWTEEANKRFLEIYGPLCSDSYRFDNWLLETQGPDILEKYRANIA